MRPGRNGVPDLTGARAPNKARGVRASRPKLPRPNRRGLNRNTQEVLVRARLLRAAVIVHLEDDTVPSPDALRYFDWAVREVLIPDVKSKDGHQITLASGYNKPKTPPRPDQSHACDTRPIWTPWGWAMDRSRLTWLLAN